MVVDNIGFLWFPKNPKHRSEISKDPLKTDIMIGSCAVKTQNRKRLYPVSESQNRIEPHLDHEGASLHVFSVSS